MAKPVTIVLPYDPRQPFLQFHRRTQRWAALVCHRRAGKTVAATNDLIKRAILTPVTKDHAPHFAYIAPYRAQAKAVAWGFLKHYSAPIQANVNESDLIVTLRNSARIQIFGADNADAMRGLGFDGLFMDEYGDFKPSVWPLVIRPTLADREGWAVFAGTPKGKNQFWDVWDEATRDPEHWYTMRLRASESGILSQTELADSRRTSTEDQYLQEYECSFDAAILGAYYGKEIRLLEENKRITDVAYDQALPTYTAWDLGYRDDTAIWWFQVIRDEIHVIDYFAASGMDPAALKKIIAERPYHYATHFLPHDAKAKTLTSGGKSLVEQLAGGENGLGLASMAIVPDLSVQDGIQATRMTLPHCWFDKTKCREGVEALRQYEREYDEDKKSFREKPKHNWCSHPADAMRMLAISWSKQQPQRRVHPDRALLVGPGNQATLNDMWAAQKRPQRWERI